MQSVSKTGQMCARKKVVEKGVRSQRALGNRSAAEAASLGPATGHGQYVAMLTHLQGVEECIGFGSAVSAILSVWRVSSDENAVPVR